MGTFCLNNCFKREFGAIVYFPMCVVQNYCALDKNFVSFFTKIKTLYFACISHFQ